MLFNTLLFFSLLSTFQVSKYIMFSILQYVVTRISNVKIQCLYISIELLGFSLLLKKSSYKVMGHPLNGIRQLQ